ncbi:MAG: hypothetical protein UY50_C0025G0027 [Parcubacteria group bacterium GW2011_GWA2_49_9]|nr:MAG: hypothetical protein UY50_C0025G0027 [Parcubacteria group bacterium GW2011_GWA2_49_9]
MHVNTAWWGAFATHIRSRSSEIAGTRLDDLLDKIGREIAAAKSVQLIRAGRPADEQSIIARASVFFRQNPQYGIF